MNHDLLHCMGKGYPENFKDGDKPTICPKRNECLRYKAAMALKQDMKELPIGHQVSFVNAIECINQDYMLLWK